MFELLWLQQCRSPPPSCRHPFSYIRAAAAAGRQKVSSIWLKIANQVACGWTIIATRGFFACQDPYGQTMLIKLSQILGQSTNLSKSLLILISTKSNFKFTFLIFKRSPIVPFLQDCRAIGGCYWKKIAKKIFPVGRSKTFVDWGLALWIGD